MASIELKLIANILESKGLEAAIKTGLKEGHFAESLARELFKFMLQHKLKYGCAPSLDQIAVRFPEYQHLPIEDSQEALVNLLKETNLGKELSKNIRMSLPILENNPRSALLHLTNSLGRLNRDWGRHTRDINLKVYAQTFHEEYENIKCKQGMMGYSYPWDALNQETGGILPQQLIALYGSPKSCKTWLLLHIATHLYLNEHRRVLVVTKEISPEAVARRASALIGKSPYKPFRLGTLSARDEKALFNSLRALNGQGAFEISDARADDGDVSVTTIYNKIEELTPDVVFVDGVYLLADSRTNQKSADYKNITHITQDLKDMAQRVNLPVIITTQANRYGDARGKEALGFSYSFAQDVDLLLRIYRKPSANEIALMVQAIREGEETGFVINAFVANNFSQKFNMITDYESFLKEDKHGDEAKNKGVRLIEGSEEFSETCSIEEA